MSEKKKLWEEVYNMIRRGDMILLDKKTLVEVYRYVHERTGMHIDDINVFVLEVVNIAASDIIAKNVSSKDFNREIYGGKDEDRV